MDFGMDPADCGGVFDAINIQHTTRASEDPSAIHRTDLDSLGALPPAITQQLDLPPVMARSGYSSGNNGPAPHVGGLSFGCTQVDKRAVLVELSDLQARCAKLESLLTRTSALTLDTYSYDGALYDLKVAAVQETNSYVKESHPDEHVHGSTSPGFSNLPTSASEFSAPQVYLSSSKVVTSNLVLDKQALQLPINETPSFGLNVGLDAEFHELFDFNAASLATGVNSDDIWMIPAINKSLSSTPWDENTVASSDLSQTQLATRGPATNTSRPRHHCHHCMKTYARRGDRDRHALSHDPNARRFSCPRQGCRHVGRNGFVRKDKLIQHRSRTGH